MTKLKFLIIGPDTENTRDLVLEIKKARHLSFVAKLKEISFRIENKKFNIFWKDYDLTDFDIFLLRGYNKNSSFAQILTQKLLLMKKVVVDETVGKEFIPSKVYEASMMSKVKISCPETYQALDTTSWKKLLDIISFPIVVKPVYGQKGQGVKKIENKNDYVKFFSDNPTGYLAQKYFNIDGDLRIFVVGDKILGAIKRFVLPGDIRSNASLGARAEKIAPTEEMKKIALLATRAMGYEIAGVDLIECNGKIYVLEVNSTPQWQRFKKITGINPAEEIISYCLKKYEKI